MTHSLIDLHVHTHYSDGFASPADVLHAAADLGLKTLSITDHDNLHAYPEALHVARHLGLELVPGVELTTHWPGCYSTYLEGALLEVDLLGYYFNPADPALLRLLDGALADLKERIAACCTLLTGAGTPVTYSNVSAVNPRYPGAVELVQALVQRGYAEGLADAYPLFIAAWRQVRPPRLEIQHAIAALHAAGGVAVLAHPVAVNCPEGLLSPERLAILVDSGLDGLEVFHPRHDHDTRQHFLALADRFNLLVSGGSDEHAWSGSFPRLGSQIITYDMLHRLQARARPSSKVNGFT